jgi:orotidine-5'-phosphate decarboxylase
MLPPNSSPIVVAMDFDNAAACLDLASRLSPQYCKLKVGKELFTACGPQIVEKLQSKGFDVFLDLKFHDIPNTTAKAVKAAAELGVWMVNVHAAGGERMMRAAREELDKLSGRKPLLIAVTVLTSMEQADLGATGVQSNLDEQVNRLANLTRYSGLDGIVCSAREAQTMRSSFGPDFCLVTPGIRMVDSPADDQRRTLTPLEAMQQGSSYLVIGRPITRADNPIEVCQAIYTELKSKGFAS